MSTGWRIVPTGDGSATLLCTELGETCHDQAGAWTQARRRYADGCRLRERARAGAALALLDLGTGLGWNLAAALDALRGTGALLDALTLERDRAPLELALELRHDPALPAEAVEAHAAVCASLRAALAAPRGLATLATAVPIELEGKERGTLTLLLGDARETLPALPSTPQFDAVFLDPFSPRVAPELWQPAFLAEIARRMAPGSLLATYSAATEVRLALARAGLAVARAPRVGRKREGTLAGPDLELGPADADLARRLRRRLEAPSEPPPAGENPSRTAKRPRPIA